MILKRSLLFLIILVLFTGIKVSAQSKKQHWVDSVYNHLTLNERIGQIFLVPAYSGERTQNEASLLKLIDSGKIGGIVCMHGSSFKLRSLINNYQSHANVPLLVGMDAEWGVAMRMDSVMELPRAMMLGATQDSLLTYKTATVLAAQCHELGVQMVFGPDADINSNSNNPIIGGRSFGSDKYNVARLSLAYMHGLQDHGIIACAKHFPGHGDTYVDSHKGLPRIDKTPVELDSLELYPFRQLIIGGLQAIMTAHVSIPSLDTEVNVSATLSKKIMTGLLQDSMQFKGLILTDALNMESISRYFKDGEAELRAFLAGNDLLLFPQDIEVAISRIKDALKSGQVSESYLEHKVKKILSYKYDLVFSPQYVVDTTNIVAKLNRNVLPIRQEAAYKSVTIAADEDKLLKYIKPKYHVAYIGVNANDSTVLYNNLHEELPTLTAHWLPKNSKPNLVSRLLTEIDNNDVAIIGIHHIGFYPSFNYGLDATMLSLLRMAAAKKNVIIVLLGNAYAMQMFGKPRNCIVSYEDNDITEKMVHEVLLRIKKAPGILPANILFKENIKLN